MKALFIDSAKREVSVFEYTDYRELGKRIGGLLSTAGYFPKGDVCVVDDEGLMKPNDHFFRIDSIRTDFQPLAGNGVVVGRDGYDSVGNEITHDPELTPETLTPLITWMTRAEAEAWSQENAGKPAVVFHDVGTGETTVLETYGGLFSKMPKE